MRSFSILLGLLFMASTPTMANPEKPEAFFQRFVDMGHHFDPSVADLYADNASISMYRRYPHGLERAMAVSGAEWKALIRQVMPLARTKNDKSTYTNIRFTSVGDNKVKINADRYAVRKCYTDSAYYLIIDRQPDSQYKVAEEYFETQAKPDC